MLQTSFAHRTKQLDWDKKDVAKTEISNKRFSNQEISNQKILNQEISDENKILLMYNIARPLKSPFFLLTITVLLGLSNKLGRSDIKKIIIKN